jgi:2-dehydro-3-deoxy-D-arabinonate dehydratase
LQPCGSRARAGVSRLLTIWRPPPSCTSQAIDRLPIRTDELPAAASLVSLERAGRNTLALWNQEKLRELRMTLDDLMRMRVADLYRELDRLGDELDPGQCQLRPPAQSQEVWACGVTYVQSRAARMEESDTADIYAKVYEADRPEIFFKSAGWRVVGDGGEVGIRSDSTWNVPEPELAVLSNSEGLVVAYACGNDMSSRSIEGENPLYLPQAKVYSRSCSIGPIAVLAREVDPLKSSIAMQIERNGRIIYDGIASLSELIRDPAELTSVLHSVYELPAGAWLMTGTSQVPAPPYTAEAGDLVAIGIEGIGRLRNTVVVVPHSGAMALPRLDR